MEMLLRIILFVIFYAKLSSSAEIRGIEREICNKVLGPISEHRKRLHDVREQMLLRSSLEGPEIFGYILTSYDEHLNTEPAERDKRLRYLTGFTGSYGIAAITLAKSAFWTEKRYLQQANGELNCDWEIFDLDGSINITTWLSLAIYPENRVGADPHIFPHLMWKQLKWNLEKNHINFVKINNNLIDLIWEINRPRPDDITIKEHELSYAGENWQSKIIKLRKNLFENKCNAIVINSLTEIAYLLNIRGRDVPYIPVVKSYLIVTHNEILFYVDRSKVTLKIVEHLKGDPDLCYNNMCTRIKDYNQIWKDLRTYAQVWNKVLIPAPSVFDKGVSEALYSAIPANIIYEKLSPVLLMKAQKNDIERNGMKKAHISDGAAICEAMCNLEQRFSSQEWTELKIKYEVERSQVSQPHSKGLAFPTVVAFGAHSSLPHYIPSNVTDIIVNDKSTLIIESGGQYLEGTTDVSRTYHFGKPTPEQKKAYTTILSGIIRLSNLKFPSDLHPSEIDILSRNAAWDSMNDYPYTSGHGIGSYSAVQESPIEVSYLVRDHHIFRDGYFLSNEPGYYKKGSFGIRLGNVLEVVNTGKIHTTGSKFLAFRETTLVPYEPKLIDRTLLSLPEKRWLNKYNARIRTEIGPELKNQGNMQAFQWMMNKTGHIREFLPEDEYRKSNVDNHFNYFNYIIIICSVFIALLNNLF